MSFHSEQILLLLQSAQVESVEGLFAGGQQSSAYDPGEVVGGISKLQTARSRLHRSQILQVLTTESILVRKLLKVVNTLPVTGHRAQ